MVTVTRCQLPAIPQAPVPGPANLSPVLVLVLTLPPARGELIAWLRDALNVSITKVEECGKGVVYCEVSVERSGAAGKLCSNGDGASVHRVVHSAVVHNSWSS
jgi:hypothetical protein